MKNTLSTIFLALLACFSYAQTTLIQNVAYVDVETGKLVPGANLLIEGETISQISRRKITPPQEAEVIDGTGKYLIPGLVDSHIHMFQSGGIYTRPDAMPLQDMRPYDEERAWVRAQASDFFKRYLTQGITTVMDVGGPMTNFDIRDEFADSIMAPTYFTTGPLISSYQPQAFAIDDPPIEDIQSPEAARALVRQQVPRNPDFIKIWYIVGRQRTAEDYLPVVEATIDEANKNNIPVAVHATGLAEAKLAVKAGAKFLVHSVSDTLDQEFINLLVDNQVVLCPTLIVSSKYMISFGQVHDSITANDYRWANPFALGSHFDLAIAPNKELIKRYQDYTHQQLESGAVSEEMAREARHLKRLVDAGVMIASGTDAGNIGTHHASSYYEELATMQRAGMTLPQILKASTLTPAYILGQQDRWGSIAKGKQADLVMLEENPLENLEALQSIAWVMRKGHKMTPEGILPDTPEMLAQRQLNAYNAGDIEAFLEPYADSVKIFRIPATEPYLVGKEAMRPGYASMFERNPTLHCNLVNRMVVDDTVVDQEQITTAESDRVYNAIAIYRMANGKIVEVHFFNPKPYDPLPNPEK